MTRLCGVAILAGLIASRPAVAQEDAGKAAYVRVCETCHGPAGKGGGQGPALVPFDIELPELLTIVRQGIGMMPAIPRDRITDEEIAQVRAYLVSLDQTRRGSLSRFQFPDPITK